MPLPLSYFGIAKIFDKDIPQEFEISLILHMIVLIKQSFFKIKVPFSFFSHMIGVWMSSCRGLEIDGNEVVSVDIENVDKTNNSSFLY